MKIEKKQLIGGGVLAVALLGVSIATGKINVSKLTGGADESQPAFKRKLPPPTTGSSAPPAHTNASVPADDVLASIAGESATEPLINDIPGESAGALANAETQGPPDFSGAPGPDKARSIATSPADFTDVTPAPAALPALASASPPSLDRGAPLASAATVNAASLVPPAAREGMAAPPLARLTPPTGSLAPPSASAPPGSAASPMTGVLPPGKGLSMPGPIDEAAPSKQTLPHEAASTEVPSERSPGRPGGESLSAAGSALAVPAPIAALPSNATGQDLLALQSQLAILEKQKAIASGQEAIAESLLKTRKAQYEMAQIGRPTAEQVAAREAAQQRLPAPMPPPPSPLASMRLLSIARANDSIGATVAYNGKLIDVKKGSVLAGYRVGSVTENSVTFVGERESKTLWID